MLRTAIVFAVVGSMAGAVPYVYSDAGREDKWLNHRRGVPETSRPVERFHPAERARTQNGSALKLGGVVTALDLLWNAESSRGIDMVGDSGKARGHFQHWRSAWDYGCKQLGVDWPYSDADNLARAAAVVGGCWAGQARSDLLSGDVEMLIRRHRLPNAPMRSSNDKYLEYVLTKGG